MKRFKIKLEFLHNYIEVIMDHKAGKEHQRAITKEIDEEGGTCYREVTFDSGSDIYDYIHEALHLVEFISAYYEIDDEEFKAYMQSWLVEEIVKRSGKKK